jgi:nucleoside-diphosphate-sugar epimerase
VRADPALGVVAGDVADAGAWQEHAAGCDLVINTAAYVGFGGQLDAVWRVNVLGTEEWLKAGGVL